MRPFFLESYTFPESFFELQKENVLSNFGNNRQFKWFVVKEKSVKIVIDGGSD